MYLSLIIYNMAEEVWVDSCVFPWTYEVSSLWRIRTKGRKITTSHWKSWWQDAIVQKQQLVNWYPKTNLYCKDTKARKAVLVHRLVYCSFNSIPYAWDFCVWCNKGEGSVVLEDLYIVDRKWDLGNKIVAYKLLQWYMEGKIELPKGCVL